MRSLFALTLTAASVVPMVAPQALEAVAQQPYWQNAGKNLASDAKLAALQTRVEALTKELNDVRTALGTVLATSSNIGTPLYAKLVGTSNYVEYNNIIRNWVESGNKLQSSKDWIYSKCLISAPGIFPSSIYDDPISFETCLRPFCKAKNDNKTPFMAKTHGICNETNGVNIDCAGGHFRLDVQCLTKLDANASQP